MTIYFTIWICCSDFYRRISNSSSQMVTEGWPHPRSFFRALIMQRKVCWAHMPVCSPPGSSLIRLHMFTLGNCPVQPRAWAFAPEQLQRFWLKDIVTIARSTLPNPIIPIAQETVSIWTLDLTDPRPDLDGRHKCAGLLTGLAWGRVTGRPCSLLPTLCRISWVWPKRLHMRSGAH